VTNHQPVLQGEEGEASENVQGDLGDDCRNFLTIFDNVLPVDE
jgi:hypothetical protein